MTEYPTESQSGLVKYRLLILIVAMCVIVSIIHGQTLFAPPLFDDKLQLTPDYIFHEFGSLASLKPRWLSYGTFAWTYQIAGENWAVFHAQNVALHCFTVIAIFIFFNRLFDVTLANTPNSTLSSRGYTLVAATGALMFGLHPVTVYAVSYLIQRSIIMATLFGVMALWCLLEARTKKRIGWYVASAVFYLLALSSKEHAVLLPAVGLAMAYLLEPQQAKWRLKAILIPAVIIAAAGAVLVHFYPGLVGNVFDKTSVQLINELSKEHPVVALHPYLLSVLNETYLFFKYLLVWLMPNPNWMSVDMRAGFPVSLTQFPQIVALFLFLGYLAGALYLLRRRHELGLLGFALLTPIVLFPTELATVWIQDPFVLYRSYLWMWALGAALPLAYRYLPPVAAIAIGSLVLMALAAVSFDRQATFKSELALWDDAVRYNSRQPAKEILGRERAYNERALALAQLGQYDKALEDYSSAIKIAPGDANVYSNRAAIYLMMGQLDKAQIDLNTVFLVEPENPKANYNQGALYMKMGAQDKALEVFTKIIEKNPNYGKEVYGARAVILLKRGEVGKALEDLNQALLRDKQYYDGYMNRGAANAMLNNNLEALSDFDVAIKLNPKSLDAHFNRAIVLAGMGRNSEALRDAENAVSLNPESNKSHLLRAQTLIALSRIKEALIEYDTVLRINPNEAMAYLNRGEVYLHLKDYVSAKRDLSQACKMGLQAACTKAAALAM